jgi:tRNA 2-thiouridine synthesizing protein A
MSAKHDILLDATDEDCPMPMVHSKNALDTMSSGQILKLISNKVGSVNNIRTLVANNPYELLSEYKSEDGFVFLIQKN